MTIIDGVAAYILSPDKRCSLSLAVSLAAVWTRRVRLQPAASGTVRWLFGPPNSAPKAPARLVWESRYALTPTPTDHPRFGLSAPSPRNSRYPRLSLEPAD